MVLQNPGLKPIYSPMPTRPYQPCIPTRATNVPAGPDCDLSHGFFPVSCGCPRRIKKRSWIGPRSVWTEQLRNASVSGLSQNDLGPIRIIKNPKQGSTLPYPTLYPTAPQTPGGIRHASVSPPSVHQMLLSLERAGLIKRQPRTPRSIELLVDPKNLPELI